MWTLHVYQIFRETVHRCLPHVVCVVTSTGLSSQKELMRCTCVTLLPHNPVLSSLSFARPVDLILCRLALASQPFSHAHNHTHVHSLFQPALTPKSLSIYHFRPTFPVVADNKGKMQSKSAGEKKSPPKKAFMWVQVLISDHPSGLILVFSWIAGATQIHFQI